MLRMTTKQPPQPHVVIDAWQTGEYVTMDWSVYRTKAGQALKRRQAHRRVMVRHAEQLSVPQLTVLAGRMAAYVLASVRGHQYVPRHLPWREVGSTEWSVPPSGGEGGESRTDVPPLTERTIRS